MKRKAKVMQLSFLSDAGSYEPKIRGKLAELEARQEALKAEEKKILPSGSRLLNHFEQKSVSKQIQLLNWLMAEEK